LEYIRKGGFAATLVDGEIRVKLIRSGSMKGVEVEKARRALAFSTSGGPPKIVFWSRRYGYYLTRNTSQAQRPI
jgi:hypothetical protein